MSYGKTHRLLKRRKRRSKKTPHGARGNRGPPPRKSGEAKGPKLEPRMVTTFYEKTPAFPLVSMSPATGDVHLNSVNSGFKGDKSFPFVKTQFFTHCDMNYYSYQKGIMKEFLKKTYEHLGLPFRKVRQRTKYYYEMLGYRGWRSVVKGLINEARQNPFGIGSDRKTCDKPRIARSCRVLVDSKLYHQLSVWLTPEELSSKFRTVYLSEPSDVTSDDG